MEAHRADAFFKTDVPGARVPRVTFADVQAARRVLEDPLEQGTIEKTPVMRAEALSQATVADVFLKLENLQRTGSFKVRGAYNRIANLTKDEKAAGVICASAGNHAQGVALAARELGVDAIICMPQDAPISKVQATRELGGDVVLHGENYNAAYDHARALETEHGYAFVHPYDDPLVVAGQGTLGLELLEQLDRIDTVLVGVGGGGLLAGIATAIKHESPQTRVIGIEPQGANALATSLQEGKNITLDTVDTIADGLATRSAGDIAYDAAQDLVDDVLVVNDDAIARAILTLLETEKTVAEGAGATGPAALLEDALDVQGERVACIISGGNIDVTLLANIIDRGLKRSGRALTIEVPLQDRPGSLHHVLGLIADTRANIKEIEHNRRRLDVGLKTALVRIDIETRGPTHADALIDTLQQAGYDARIEP